MMWFGRALKRAERRTAVVLQREVSARLARMYVR